MALFCRIKILSNSVLQADPQASIALIYIDIYIQIYRTIDMPDCRSDPVNTYEQIYMHKNIDTYLHMYDKKNPMENPTKKPSVITCTQRKIRNNTNKITKIIKYKK